MCNNQTLQRPTTPLGILIHKTPLQHTLAGNSWTTSVTSVMSIVLGLLDTPSYVGTALTTATQPLTTSTPLVAPQGHVSRVLLNFTSMLTIASTGDKRGMPSIRCVISQQHIYLTKIELRHYFLSMDTTVECKRFKRSRIKCLGNPTFCLRTLWIKLVWGAFEESWNMFFGFVVSSRPGYISTDHSSNCHSHVSARYPLYEFNL